MSEDAYLYKDRNGITDYGGSSPDFLMQQLIPYQVINFPALPGYSYVQSHKADLASGLDLDLDGVSETMDVLSRVTVVGLDTISVPAGAYVNCARIKTDTQLTMKLSSDGSTSVFRKFFYNTWYAPDVGPVKHTNVYTYPDGTVETVAEVLTAIPKRLLPRQPTSSIAPSKILPATITGPFCICVNNTGKSATANIKYDVGQTLFRHRSPR